MNTMVFRNEFEQVSALALADLTHEMQCCLYEMPAMANLGLGNFLTIGGTARAMAVAFETGRRLCLFEAAEAVSNPSGTKELSMEEADWRRSLWNRQSSLPARVSARLGSSEATPGHPHRKPKALRGHTMMALAEGRSLSNQ